MERQVSEQPTKSLAARMVGVMGDVPTMIKTGRNVAQKYEYVTAEDVKAIVRPLLRKHGIAVFSEITDVQRETSVNKNGTLVVSVLVKMRFTLACAETGETMACEWYGEANDYADKAVNKGSTAAEKYFLISTFLLSTSEPDADEETIEQAAPTPISKEQYDKINSLGKSVYGQGWATSAQSLIAFFTDDRTARAGEMTSDEAEQMFDRLTEIHAAKQEAQQAIAVPA
jgi:hypothetical protein